MDVIKVIYPGLGLCCAVFLVFLGSFQLRLYLKKGYERSKALAIFCFLTSLFAFNVTVVYSWSFPVGFVRFYVEGLQFVLFLSFYYYVQSLSYFVSIPAQLKTFYSRSMLVFAVLALIPYFWYLLTGEFLYFDPNIKPLTGNFFVDAYTQRLGEPNRLVLAVLSLSSLLNVVLTSVVLYRLRSSSKDIFLTLGLLFTLFASAMDYLFLPFFSVVYVPVLFLSNIFEGFRMCYLSAVEDYIETTNKILLDEKEVKESQHNMSIDEVQLKRISYSLIRLLEEQELFKDPLLKIDTLGRQLKVPSYIISQVLRFGLGTNFSNLIADYRIQYVKKVLENPSREQDSILDIAIEAGFNSKSSFNQTFKKITGETPSQYRRKKQSS